MKTSFDSIAFIVIGLFGIIAGIINKGIYLNFLWWGKYPGRGTQRMISIIPGSLALLFGLLCLRKLNLN